MNSRSASWAFAAGCALLLVLLTQPYWGLRHDGILYLGQILHRVHPAVFSADLFFAHGSQDRYSVYATVLMPLYRLLPIDHLQMLLIALASAASLTAIYQLLEELSPTTAWMGVFCVAALNHSYGGRGIFNYSEEFLTARTVAEPLVLWGLVALQRWRIRMAGMGLVMAAAFHPLMALPAWVIAWLRLQAADRRWRWALLLIPLILIPALAGLAPFDGLLHRYDDAWWRLVKDDNSQTLISQWQWADWQLTLVDGALLAAAGLRFAPPRLAALCRMTGLVALALVGISILGGDVGRNVLLTGLQLWRVLWLAHVLALACLPCVLERLWCMEPQDSLLSLPRLAALLVATAVLAACVSWSMGWVILLAAGLVLVAAYRRIAVSQPVLAFAAGGALLSMLGLDLFDARIAYQVWRTGYADPLASPPWVLLLGEPVFCLPLVFGAWQFWQHRERWRAGLALALTLLIVAAAPQWDRRSDWARLLEHGGLQREHPFDSVIPPNAQVYWHRELAATWLLLGRASYYARGQGAGLLFNEGTARDFGPRWEQFKPIGEAVLACRIGAAMSKQNEADCITPSADTVRELCAKQARLDYLVFQRPLGPTPLSTWNPHLPSHPELSFYLYACTQFR